MNVRNQADDLSDHSHGAPPRLKLGALGGDQQCPAVTLARVVYGRSQVVVEAFANEVRWWTSQYEVADIGLLMEGHRADGSSSSLAAAHPRGGARHRCLGLGAKTGGGHVEPVQPVEALGEVGCRSPTPPMKYLSDFTTSTCEAPYTTHSQPRRDHLPRCPPIDPGHYHGRNVALSALPDPMTPS